MTVEQLANKTFKRLKEFKISTFLPALKDCPEGAINDVLNTNGVAYYQWLPGLIEEIEPKQIIELGGAMGVSALMMLNSKYQDFRLYSITLAENGLEFSYIKDIYPNLIKVIGDDLDLKTWPASLYFAKTDLWFFDSLHTEKQLRAELELYSKFFRKGNVLLFDDIRMPEIWKVWEELPYDKIELTNPLHYSGFGMCVV